MNATHHTEHGITSTDLITRTQNSNTRLRLLVVGIFLALLSYLGTVVYHSHNHGFRGLSVDNPFDGYANNLVQSDDGRISELLYVAASQEERSSLVIPEWIGMMATERSLGSFANEESHVEGNNYMLSLSHLNGNEIDVEDEMENENENENENIDGIERTESGDNRSEQEERERSGEREVEVVEETESSQHSITHPHIQSLSSSSSSTFPSLPSPQVVSEDADEDVDMNMDDVNDIDTAKEINNDSTETEIERGVNQLADPQNNNDNQTPIRSIQINNIFNVPFPENISDSYENESENNGFPSEEKIKKYISSLLKSFEHIHSSDYM